MFRALLAVTLLATRAAEATPQLEVAIAWQGDCDDRPALLAEAQARGADLHQVDAQETALTMAIWVRSAAHGRLVADVLLSAPGSQQTRHVEARECLALRRAVAWLLVVLAEEHEAQQRASRPAAAVFPTPPAPPRDATTPDQSTPPLSRQRGRPPERPRVQLPNTCVSRGPRWQLGSELLVGVAFTDAFSLGPAIVGAYRPCAKWVPGISVGASQLTSVGYELDRRSIRLGRTSGRAGVWAHWGVPGLRFGLALEAGRIVASGTASAGGPGGVSRAPWLAIAAPVRLAAPLLRQALVGELGVEGLYVPLSYRLRYESGKVLAKPGHFELRFGLGLSARF